MIFMGLAHFSIIFSRLGYAPLGLCYDSNFFDLKFDPRFCPPERNALREFFDDGGLLLFFLLKDIHVFAVISCFPGFTAKGIEWSNSKGWGEQFTSVCDWYGVNCNEANQPVELVLKSNGLSGKNSMISSIRV